MGSIRVHITPATRKALQARLKEVYRKGDHRLARRITALLLFADGYRITGAAELLGITRQTVYAWLRALMLEGLESLHYRKSPGRPGRLTKTQKRELVDLIKAGPQAAGFETACWTALLVQQLIERKFGVLYSRHYVCELLHNLGFSYQKAAFVADHLDADARRIWLEETWPTIAQLAQEKEAWILFQDEVSFAQWGSLGYTWAPVGEQPVVKTSGKRKGYKVFGVIELTSGRCFYQTLTERFNSERYQDFLTYVLAQTTQHVILIQDGARYHTSKSTRAFFAAHRDQLTVFQLPSYSPDYNPIEFLWKQVKQRATHNQYFPQFDDLIAAVDRTLAFFAQQPERIRGLIGRYLQDLALVPQSATV